VLSLKNKVANDTPDWVSKFGACWFRCLFHYKYLDLQNFYTCKVNLISFVIGLLGFEYVTDMDEKKLFRKRK
jgi:hypothetical protein